MSHSIQIKIEAPSTQVAIPKARYAESIANKASLAALAKIDDLLSKPGAEEKFLKALNNPLIMRMF